MNIKDKCAVVVCSCDKNEDLWPMFFYFFKKYWPSCDLDIILNTESKKYKDKDLKIKHCNFTKKGKDQWSYRLKRHLKCVEHDYVLLILDDFFFTDMVDEDELNLCINRMEKDKEIALLFI